MLESRIDDGGGSGMCVLLCCTPMLVILLLLEFSDEQGDVVFVDLDNGISRIGEITCPMDAHTCCYPLNFNTLVGIEMNIIDAKPFSFTILCYSRCILFSDILIQFLSLVVHINHSNNQMSLIFTDYI